MSLVSAQKRKNRAPTRREFLKRGAGATFAAAIFPAIIPATALGRGGKVAPSERIVMGCIGTGSQGIGNLKNFLAFKSELQVVAVCDVEKAHREEARQLVNGAFESEDCQGHNDFRELLARDDIDAVSIAVPDHWHSIPAIMAADRGFDIYAEKPLALTISEGRAMVKAVERNGTVWQTGSWQRSRPDFLRGCELVRNGAIGKVHTVNVGLPAGTPCEVQPAAPVPEGFDYDLWLGPAPFEPYTEKRCHWNFRWILDYSGGQLTDWAAHHCDIANWAMGTEHTGPISAEGVGVFPKDGLWDAATDYFFTCEFPAGASSVSPEGFIMKVSNSFPMGARFEGENGEWIHIDRSGLSASRDEILKLPLGEKATRLYRSENHGRNFLDCVRARKQCIAPIEPAHRAVCIAHIGNIAMQLERKVNWNPKKEEFIGDAQANRMLSRGMRGDWKIA